MFTWPTDRGKDQYWEYSASDLYRSYSWAAAQNFFNYARNYSGHTTVKGRIESLWLGDIIQYDVGWDGMNHSMIVVNRTGTGKVYLAMHTPNRTGALLQDLRVKYPTSSTGWYYTGID